jgi:hypothetical protein
LRKVIYKTYKICLRHNITETPLKLALNTNNQLISVIYKLFLISMSDMNSMLIDIYSTFRVKYETRYTGISYFGKDLNKSDKQRNSLNRF